MRKNSKQKGNEIQKNKPEETNSQSTSFDLLQTDEYDFTKVLEDSSSEEEKIEDQEKNEVKKSSPNYEIEELFNEKKEKDTNVSASKVETPDINAIFEQANNNIMSAKNIFNQNIEMKQQLDLKFDELKKLKAEHEQKKNEDYQKIKIYKTEVYEKLQLKKEEVEEQLEKLKDVQNTLNDEKNKFEMYKHEEIDKLRNLRKEQKNLLDQRKNELDALENDFRIQKDLFEEEKRQLELDRIKYSADKNELANNLLKFNELVSDFSVNIDRFNDKK